MKYYKIQNKKTGLFSKGGMSPCFSKTGKAWTSIGTVNSHLSQFNKLPHGYKDCVIVELEFVETLEIDLNEHFNNRIEKRNKAKEEQEQRWAEARKQREIAEASRILKKYGVTNDSY